MPPHRPHITVRAIQPVVAGLDALGHDAAAVLAEAGVDPAVLDDADGRVPHEVMMRVWLAARARSGDENVGLQVGEAAPWESFEVHAYAVSASPTLREGLRRGCRYQRLIHEATDLLLDERSDGAVLYHALPGGRAVPRHPAEFLAAVWLRFARSVAGEALRPERVGFAHASPASTEEHRCIFASPVHFSVGRTEMHFTADALDAPNPRADLGLVRVLDRYAGALLSTTVEHDSLAGRVRAWLDGALVEGTPTAAPAAEALHMSVRSLHRGLRAEGTSFGELLVQLRYERAAAMLAEPRCSITEVGFLLGFAETSSFYRAFKRWTGETPHAYRARLRSG